MVSVLAGGFISLIEQLQKAAIGDSLEPIIIQHNSQKWDAFLQLVSGAKSASPSKNEKYNSSEQSIDVSPVTVSPLDKARVGLEVAIRMNHLYMKSQLEKKILVLEDSE